MSPQIRKFSEDEVLATKGSHLHILGLDPRQVSAGDVEVIFKLNNSDGTPVSYVWYTALKRVDNTAAESFIQAMEESGMPGEKEWETDHE